MAFTISLPEADIVGEPVHVAVDPLLALIDAPDLDTLLHKPFQHEGRLLCPPAKAVKHEYQKDIEFAFLGILLDELDLITVIGTDLKARHTVFLFLQHDIPALAVGELVAGFALNWDVRLILFIMIHLLGGRDSI